MLMQPLRLRSVKTDSLAARRRLGRGLSMEFQVAGRQGELLLEPARAPQGVRPLFFETARGVLAFGEPGPQFSLLGDCPVTLAATSNDPDSWFWALFEYHLSPQIKALFGHLRLISAAKNLNFGCRLTVSQGSVRVVGYVWLSPDSFLALCEAGRWRSTAKPISDQFQLAISLTLGRLRLPIAQVCSLQGGDVLILEQAFFQIQGAGYVRVGGRRLYGQINDASGPLSLTLTAIEETSVDEEFALSLPPEHGDDQPIKDVFGPEPFDELSMALNVRCGTMNLTLGELRNLAPGTVLGVNGYAPGMAGLYYGDRPIARGQLVEVDGQLGLQLSRVALSQ
ncbi:FliM/FliN family flagellar motor switch protein [Pseudomonas fluorescens]|uniref:FliM/FliN family flagellar motor switch protein n=1 Tax=Pseudomonas fluorescens group TaxID=136843 RepID=UPI0015E714C7|nr:MULTISPECIES: FliM/FliN family flagellar motor switch protein [Pseudomonas fluorescens group]MBA1427000.1 YscQ/HrcQ family type III secretion apparatus protein [Pseudomonas orientalis]MBD8147423.1 FliM/FliN family flagellar motor switch protein [Pseudomonas fluorescens]MBD8175895.1 FliM/FliN family flagellar motor switch protein [Pseudomonas fluorescens]MBD8744350.1 FliM/FliN family flagellar motor switch protein [Pseudomonas fluorescens]MBD8753311.1 FliM/FliN family flagellar motor switch 